MPGMGLTSYPNQYEVNKSDKDKINNKVKMDAQYVKTKELKEKSNQKPTWQNPTTPTVSGISALDKITSSYRDIHRWDKDKWDKAAPALAEEQKAKKAAEEASKESAPKKASEDLNPWDVSGSFNNLGDKLTGKSTSESSEGEKDTYKSGNPNGELKVDSNAKPEDGMGRLDKESEKPVESSAPAKEEPTSAPTTTAPVSKPKAKAKSSGSRRNPDLENEGKTKEWYENLANSSYANDKKYEADMQAYNKMKSDEIAKNGYYTDSQGVKVYAKAMSDTPKEKKNA